MKILSLNCRGLRILEAVLELRCLTVEEGPQVLFLHETKLDKGGLTYLKRKLEFTQGLEVFVVVWGLDLLCCGMRISILLCKPFHLVILMRF